MTLRTNSLATGLAVALLATAATLTAVSVAAIAARQKGHDELASLIAQYAADPGVAGKTAGSRSPGTSAPDPRAERIGKRHVFSPAPPQQGFPGNLAGVLGDEVFFAGQPQGLKVGQAYQGATIRQIGPDWVEMERDGKRQKLYVFAAKGASPHGPRGGTMRVGPGVRPTGAGPGPAPPGPGRAEPPKHLPPGPASAPADMMSPPDVSITIQMPERR